MAEELENFSPLDPLGPAYGKINKPTLDIQGVTPFEGDRITQEPINFPRPFHAAMPGVNVTQPQANVRNNVVGAPGVEPNKNKTASDLEIRTAHADFIKGSLQANRSKDQFAKIYSYDAGPDGNAFYDRYMAYGKEKFDQIGFSPLRDNESIFNSRTTMADDWKRMMTNSFWPLFTSGFTSGPRSLAKMLTGDFTSADLKDARTYEEAAAIGMSSKGGLMGFMNNTVMNFGYTAGIISEVILEEAAAALLAPTTAGASLFAVTANNLRRVKGIGAAVDGMTAARAALKNASTVSGARQTWNAVNRTMTGTTLGRYLNPLENTFEAINRIKLDNLTGLAKLSATAGGLYRDVRTINMAVSEARLEAGMVENSVYDKAYKKYYREFGKAPDDYTQKEMVKNAKDASLDTFYKNATLIYATNKITFNNITSPRGGIRNFIKSTVDDVATVGGGKFGNIGRIVYDNAAKKFAFEANNIKNLAKSWWKNPGFKTAVRTIGYFKANFTEGFQENAQEIIARANERYYLDSFDSKMRQAHQYSMAVADYNMKSQSQYYKEELGREVSMQGLETFASGFFMGMLAAPLNNSIHYLSIGYNRIFDKEAYNDYKTKKEKISNDLVEELNNVKMDEFLKSKLFDFGAQDIISRIKRTGDKKESIDAEHEALVMSMLESGVSEVFAEKIRSMNELDDNEFMDAMSIEKDQIQEYRERIDYAANKMERIRKTHQYYQDKYPNPIREEDFKDLDKDSAEFYDAVALYNGWNLAVKNAVFFNETFEDTKQRMNDVEKKFLRSVNREKTGLRELGLLLTPNRLAQEVQLLNKEADSLEALASTDRATRDELKKKRDLAKNIEAYMNALDEFDLFYNRDEEAYVAAKEEASKKLKREATKEEVELYLDKKLGKLDDEKKQTKILNNLKSAFSNYAKYVSESNEDFAFDDNLEKAFTLLTDHYKLGSEARQMAKYIDRLNNPEVIFEIADRNKEWMKGLYNRRKRYYSKMVKEQMKVVEHNALLNALANVGAFVPLDQFEKWQQTGEIPSEFFDNVNKQVIIPGSEQYTFLSMFFQQASELDTTTEEETAAEVSLDEPVELITPKNIQDVLAALRNLDAKKLVTRGNEYVNVDDPSDAYARVSTRKGEFEGKNKKAANRGTIIDDMLRAYINGTATTIEDIRKIYVEHPLRTETQRFSDDFIRQLFDIFTEVKEIADNRGLTLTANIPTLWGTLDNKKYAGTIDLLGIDKDGQVYIIDLKTSSQNRRDASGEYYERFRENDKIQLSSYAELLRQRTGITIKNITIFPVQVTIEKNAYTTAEANKEDGKFTMQVEIDRETFPETPKKKITTPTETPISTDAKADIDISEGEAVSVHTPRKLFKARLNRIKENQEGKRRADHSSSAEGYVVSLKSDTFNETDEQGRPMLAGAEVYLNQDEIDEILRIETKRKMGLISASQKDDALQQLYRDVFKRALSTYEIVEDAEFETEVEDRRSKYNRELAALGEELPSEGISVGRELSDKAKAKLAKLGFTNIMIESMSNNELEQAKTFNTVEEANELREMITTRLKVLESEEETAVPKEKEPVKKKEGILIEKKGSPAIKDVVGKTVYYKGKPYIVAKEGVKYILNSDTTIVELSGTQNSTLESLGITYLQGEYYKPEYDIVINNENLATVDGVDYIVKTDALGNVIGLSPINKPEQTLKNEKLLVAVEIERNKTNFVAKNNQLDSIDAQQAIDDLETTDPNAHQKLMNVERVYNTNWSTTVESGLSNLYSKKPLSSSERLAVDLWVTDAIINMTKVYNRTPDPIYANALDNLEIINTLLYEGYTEKTEKLGINESAKRKVEQTDTEAKRKPGKTVTEKPTVVLSSKALNKLGFTDLMLENMSEKQKLEASSFTTVEDAAMFRDDIIKSQRALGVDHPFITEFNITKDAQLVAKDTIDTTDSNNKRITFASKDDIVVVESINRKEGTVTLQKLGTNSKIKDVDISILDEGFVFKDEIMEAPEKAEETITNKADAAKFTAETNDLLDAFLDSKERQAFIEQRTKDPDFTIDDIEDELLDDLIC